MYLGYSHMLVILNLPDDSKYRIYTGIEICCYEPVYKCLGCLLFLQSGQSLIFFLLCCSNINSSTLWIRRTEGGGALNFITDSFSFSIGHNPFLGNGKSICHDCLYSLIVTPLINCDLSVRSHIHLSVVCISIWLCFLKH